MNTRIRNPSFLKIQKYGNGHHPSKRVLRLVAARGNDSERFGGIKGLDILLSLLHSCVDDCTPAIDGRGLDGAREREVAVGSLSAAQVLEFDVDNLIAED